MPDRDLSPLEEAISVRFTNPDLLRQALIHRSYLNEHRTFRLGHNERLEFLGDAVLELVVTEHLYDRYRDKSEGELTNWRASLVNATMLGRYATDLHLERYLYLSRGEAQDTNGKARSFILADAFEAVIGAIYLDKGYARAKKFILRFLEKYLPTILEQQLYRDPKSRFQEASQERLAMTPMYKVLSEEGPDHAKQFRVGVYIGSEMVAEGKGTSKQEAQVDAAAKALIEKGWE